MLLLGKPHPLTREDPSFSFSDFTPFTQVDVETPRVIGLDTQRTSLIEAPHEVHHVVNATSFSSRTVSTSLTVQDISLFINLFYSYFHPAHPCLLPWLQFEKRIEDKSLAFLEAVVIYIGSCYALSPLSRSLKEAVDHALFNESPPRNGYLVQAMLLFAIALSSSNERCRAAQILDSAIDLALELRMNERYFASAYGNGCQVLEESWRRTWWELYCVEALLSKPHQTKALRLYSTQSDNLLPCEETDYLAGKVSPLGSSSLATL